MSDTNDKLARLRDIVERLGLVAFNHGLFCGQEQFREATLEGARRGALQKELLAEIDRLMGEPEPASAEAWRKARGVGDAKETL